MKTTFLTLILAVPMLVIGVASIEEAPGSGENAGRSKAEMELDHSFRQLRQHLLNLKAGAEQSRIAMADWQGANESKLNELGRQRADVIKPAPPDPGAPPTRDDMSAAEFIEEVAAYHNRLGAFVGHLALMAGDVGIFREEMARHEEQPAMKAMALLDDEARAELAENQDDALPLSSDELAGLTGSEQAEEEIYAAIYAVTRKPFSPGDHFRDRVAPLHEWIEEKRASHPSQPE